MGDQRCGAGRRKGKGKRDMDGREREVRGGGW
jgi:hypothetical protein